MCWYTCSLVVHRMPDTNAVVFHFADDPVIFFKEPDEQSSIAFFTSEPMPDRVFHERLYKHGRNMNFVRIQVFIHIDAVGKIAKAQLFHFKVLLKMVDALSYSDKRLS